MTERIASLRQAGTLRNRVNEKTGSDPAFGARFHSVRRAQQKNKVRLGRGGETCFSVDPTPCAVAVTQFDKIGRVTDEIEAIRTNTSGKLSDSDEFMQSDYVRWRQTSYGPQSRSERLYHDIPSSGTGSQGTNYEESSVSFNQMNRVVRRGDGGGTIPRTVYHARGWPKEEWGGTDDSGATNDDLSGGGATSNNMLKVLENEFDHGNAGEDGNLTKEPRHVDSGITRVTQYTYEYNRQGEQIKMTDQLGTVHAYEYDGLILQPC